MKNKVRTKDGRFELRVSVQKLELWRQAAKQEGMSLADWITASCDADQAEISEKTMKAEQRRLERVQMVREATPQATGSSTLPFPERMFRGPDPK